MEYQRGSRGLQTFFEHGWMPLLTAGALFGALGFALIRNLAKAPGFWWIGVGFAVMGAYLIFHAKLPLYREGRYFTLGRRALPGNRRWAYGWGYCSLVVGLAWLAWCAWSMT